MLLELLVHMLQCIVRLLLMLLLLLLLLMLLREVGIRRRLLVCLEHLMMGCTAKGSTAMTMAMTVPMVSTSVSTTKA